MKFCKDIISVFLTHFRFILKDKRAELNLEKLLTGKKIDDAAETVKIGKTLFVVNHLFEPSQTKRDAWLSIITRAEGLKPKNN